MLPLIAFLGVTAQTPQRTDPALPLRMLYQSYSQAEVKYYEQYNKARTDEERSRVVLDPAKNPAKAFVPKFEELGRTYGKTNLGFVAWMTAFDAAMKDRDNPAGIVSVVSDLIPIYVDSPQMERLVRQIPAIRDALAALPETNRNQAIDRWETQLQRSKDTLVLASLLFTQADEVNQNEPGGSTKARSLYAEVIAKYPSTRYAAKARRIVDEIGRLSVGMAAPDFSAVDQDGVAFKLSDYRGKVVVLDFWGVWCGHCRELLPYNKQLVEKYKDQPFALLGVDSDGERSAQIVKGQGLNYRNALDGKTSGPIATAWNVHGWPTAYVIDRQGIIRYKSVGVDAADLTRAIDAVMKSSG